MNLPENLTALIAEHGLATVLDHIHDVALTIPEAELPPVHRRGLVDALGAAYEAAEEIERHANVRQLVETHCGALKPADLEPDATPSTDVAHHRAHR